MKRQSNKIPPDLAEKLFRELFADMFVDEHTDYENIQEHFEEILSSLELSETCLRILDLRHNSNYYAAGIARKLNISVKRVLDEISYVNGILIDLRPILYEKLLPLLAKTEPCAVRVIIKQYRDKAQELENLLREEAKAPDIFVEDALFELLCKKIDPFLYPLMKPSFQTVGLTCIIDVVQKSETELRDILDDNDSHITGIIDILESLDSRLSLGMKLHPDLVDRVKFKLGRIEYIKGF